MAVFHSKKPETLFHEALRGARTAPVPEAIDRRRKDDRMFDKRGYRRLVAYLTPAEFRELEVLSSAEGASLSVTLRACLRSVVEVKDP